MGKWAKFAKRARGFARVLVRYAVDWLNPSPNSPKDLLREWHVGLGIPALAYALGFTLMTIGSFWLGYWTCIAAAFFLAIDWWRYSAGRPISTRIIGLGISFSLIAVVSWLAFRPIYMGVAFSDPNFPEVTPGTKLLGIAWEKRDYQISFVVKNDTDLEFTDVRGLILTDRTIRQVSVDAGIDHCMVSPDIGSGVKISSAFAIKRDANGTVTTVPMTIASSTIFKLTCEKISPHSVIEITLAVLGYPSSGNAYVKYTAGYRSDHSVYLAQCIASYPCKARDLKAMQALLP